MRNTTITIALAIVLALAIYGVWVFASPRSGCTTLPCGFGGTPAPAATSSTVGLGEHCGGFIRNAPECAIGLQCELNRTRPDTGGTCVPLGAATSTSGMGGILPYHSGIRGTVILGPTCPVEQNPPLPQCADKPYQTLVAVFKASDAVHAVALIESGKDGMFSVSLPPGDYTLGAGESMLPRCSHLSVTIPPDAYASTTISCDTGIR